MASKYFTNIGKEGNLFVGTVYDSSNNQVILQVKNADKNALILAINSQLAGTIKSPRTTPVTPLTITNTFKAPACRTCGG